MQNIRKRNIYFLVYILISILLFLTSTYIEKYTNSYDITKNRMYNDYMDFGKSLEELNSKLSSILVLDNYEFDNKQELVNKDKIGNFLSSDFDAFKLARTYDYPYYLDTYLDANDTINKILEDGKIDKNEKRYLETLYEYNQELINEYKNTVGILYHEEYNYEKTEELQDNIVDIYNNYSLKSENLLNSPKYELLKEYKGNFENVEFKKIELYCKEIFSLLVNDKTLKYNNKDEIHSDKYIFRTYQYDESATTLLNDEVNYSVEYNKNTNEATVRADSYTTTSKTKKYKENELDKMANDLVNKLNKNALNYNKEIVYDDKNNIDYIRYSYIEKSNDVYDEMKKLEIVIQSHGLISDFKTVYPYNKEIIMPTLTKEEILNKVNNEAKIEEIFMVRTLENKIVYEIHLSYNNTVYAAVFDGNDGNLEYYGREVRNYLNS